MSKEAGRLPKNLFCRGFLENKKEPETIFQASSMVEFSDKFFSFVILHKLAKFHYQSILNSQAIQ